MWKMELHWINSSKLKGWNNFEFSRLLWQKRFLFFDKEVVIHFDVILFASHQRSSHMFLSACQRTILLMNKLTQFSSWTCSSVFLCNVPLVFLNALCSSCISQCTMFLLCFPMHHVPLVFLDALSSSQRTSRCRKAFGSDFFLNLLSSPATLKLSTCSRRSLVKVPRLSSCTPSAILRNPKLFSFFFFCVSSNRGS